MVGTSHLTHVLGPTPISHYFRVKIPYSTYCHTTLNSSTVICFRNASVSSPDCATNGRNFDSLGKHDVTFHWTNCSVDSPQNIYSCTVHLNIIFKLISLKSFCINGRNDFRNKLLLRIHVYSNCLCIIMTKRHRVLIYI